MTRIHILSGLLLFVSGTIGDTAWGQTQPLQGVVWQQPTNVHVAQADLHEMRRLGVQAVRTGLVRDTVLLALADTLGLQFFQELPVVHMPARRLRDTLNHATAQLDQALALADGYASARHFGLLRHSDTSDPDACAYIEALARRVRARGAAGSSVYYASPFVASDACSAYVDFVLLDLLDASSPSAALMRWQDQGRVGVGSVGTWVRADTLSGLQVAGTPEVQARYLEEGLNALLDDRSTVALVAIFVQQWRDEQDTGDDRQQVGPYRRSYGMFSREGEPRPALVVLEGIYTGEQRVFAFPSGSALPAGKPWLVLLGWGVLIMMAVTYAGSPRFRHTVPRYFWAHHFYRQAVREGRDVLPVVSAVLFVGLATACGFMGRVVILAVREHAAFVQFLRYLPVTVQGGVVALLDQPTLLMGVMATVYGAGLALWAIMLTLVAGRRSLAPPQAMMLVAWPRWSFFLVMIIAMVMAADTEPNGSGSLIILLLAWMLAALWASARTLLDFISITRALPGRILFASFIHPLVLIVIVGLFLLLLNMPEAEFMWHLLVRQ